MDGQIFHVKFTQEPIGGESGERAFLGKSEEATNTIVIDGTMPRTRQEEVLLHELMHLAIAGLPEGLIRDFSVGLYGILKQNDLLMPDILERVSDGTLSPEETATINRQSNQLAQEPQVMFRQVSETSWDGPVFEEDGVLAVYDASGVTNRNAAHLACAQLLGARGGVRLSLRRRQTAALSLKRIYEEALQEPVPAALASLALD